MHTEASYQLNEFPKPDTAGCLTFSIIISDYESAGEEGSDEQAEHESKF